jgi:hypothetical protein
VYPVLLSHNKKFIFTKTAKTAGTSVEMYFEPYCLEDSNYQLKEARPEYVEGSGIVGFRGWRTGKERFYNHMAASEIIKLIGPDIWNSYFKFTVVRNPFDKMVSGFFHFEKSRKADSYKNDKRTEVERFRDWIFSGAKIVDRDKYLVDGKISMDYFIRYENLSDGIKEVCHRLAIPFNEETIPKTKTQHRDRSLKVIDFYDEKTANIVKDLFEFEIDYFGYKLE